MAKPLLGTVESPAAYFDATPLTSRYWLIFGLLGLQLVLELFDFFVIGFIMSSVAPGWGLTVLQTVILLLSTGVGAIVGSVTLGRTSDRIGRKPVMVAGGLLCSLSCMATAAVPDGAWLPFAALRFLVGVGYGAAGVAQFSLIVELTPTRLRTLLSSALSITPSVGLIIASSLAAKLFMMVGWRGLALAGGIPVLFTLLAAIFVPESFRWQISRNRTKPARQTIAWLTRTPIDSLPAPAPAEITPPSLPATAPMSALYSRPRTFWLILITYGTAATAASGVYLWGPTIGTQMLGLSPAAAAGYFVLIGVAGLLGRIAITLGAARYGRRPIGALAGVLAGVLLMVSGLAQDAYIGAVPAMMLSLIAASFFFDGSFANLAPYAGELYPVSLSGRALGLAQAASGTGKFLGPLILALLAGSSNFVTPKLVAGVALPALLTLGAFAMLGGLTMALIGEETRNRALKLDAEER